MIKYLGKITSAEFGKVSDYPYLMGLQLFFQLSDKSQIGDGGKYTVNLSKSCRWEESDRNVAVTAAMDKVNAVLTDAKVDCVSSLVNKPVEVTVENNTFKDFRILTEVL